MGGSLGEKIGEGAYSDVHAWAPGQVLKLFKAGFPRRHSWWEARMTLAVFAAGGPAPEVLEQVTLEGRFGIVLPRLDGPTLRQLLQTGAITSHQAATILANLYRSVHATPPPPALLPLRDWFAAVSRHSGDMLPKHIENIIQHRRIIRHPDARGYGRTGRSGRPAVDRPPGR